MKPTINFKSLLFSLLLISGTVFSQQQNTTPLGTDTIQCHLNARGIGEHKYEFMPLVPIPAGASNAHLWWSGDNEFSFVPSPTYAHERRGVPYRATMTDVVTENYGNGGPPPLTYTLTTDGGNRSPRVILNSGNNIYMQSYRNAVIDDTMYLIVTYKNPSRRQIAGTLKFDVGMYGRIVESMFVSHPQFLPNGEQWDAIRRELILKPIAPGVEQSVLIPVLILNTDEEELSMKVNYFLDGLNWGDPMSGINEYQITATVAHSHDPNLMLESSDAKNQCDYRNGTIHYTVKFQNTGDGPTRYVRVECQLDDKVDLNRITGVTFPTVYQNNYDSVSPIVGSANGSLDAIFFIDRTNRKLIFEMNGLVLQGTGDELVMDLETTRSQVEFDIKVKSNYIFGPATIAVSSVYFDGHDPIVTNEVNTICGDPIPVGRGGGFQRPKLEVDNTILQRSR